MIIVAFTSHVKWEGRNTVNDLVVAESLEAINYDLELLSLPPSSARMKVSQGRLLLAFHDSMDRNIQDQSCLSQTPCSGLHANLIMCILSGSRACNLFKFIRL